MTVTKLQAYCLATEARVCVNNLPKVVTRQQHCRESNRRLSYSNTTVYYGIHKRSECIPVDSGITNLIHDRRSCVGFTLEVEANVARCVHSSVNKPGLKRNSAL